MKTTTQQVIFHSTKSNYWSLAREYMIKKRKKNDLHAPLPAQNEKPERMVTILDDKEKIAPFNKYI